ncbi:proton pump-interactor 1-like isoform X1 [Diospyros lotus]|uniref:proton pump-interactor 1-like isoform X1 n=1 Tax=Diospyros lotus TaxID=55363 RepID=UPI0022520E05|nr:proton pump-interactor 1-like isoform X1 [Diospyros lotus]
MENMDVETVKSELAPVSLESGNEDSNSLAHDKENGTVHEGSRPSEPMKVGSQGIDEQKTQEGNNASEANLPKDAADEWPAPNQIHSFYFIKYRSYEDPKLKAKLDQADKDIQKKTEARSQLIEKLRAKRSDRAEVIAQLKPLSIENKQFWTVVNEKRKEIEPLQQALGKLRGTNSVNRDKNVALCSSEEELNNLIKSLHYRIQHESIPLAEEKQLLREIKQLDGTRERVVANDSLRAKIQDSMGEKEAIQDQVKLMGVDLDGVRKEHQVVQSKLKQLTDEKEAIEKETKSLEVELTDLTGKREKAYESFQELRKQREEGNSCYYQNRALLNRVRELATKKDIEALEEIRNVEVEKFLSLWNSNKAFRHDYEQRILPSLDIRQLSRDGRMRNPDEKPLVLPEPTTFSETGTVTKINVKQPKENSISSLKHDTALADKVQKETKSKPQKEAKNNPTDSGTILEPADSEGKGRTSESEKTQKDLNSNQNKVDEAKLKEMKREEQIAKAKQALERKKRLAEKAAAKAAIKAQKEAEKKMKEIILEYLHISYFVGVGKCSTNG